MCATGEILILSSCDCFPDCLKESWGMAAIFGDRDVPVVGNKAEVVVEVFDVLAIGVLTRLASQSASPVDKSRGGLESSL